MGEKTISTQVKIDGDIAPDFSQDWEVEFQGEKYIMPLRQPQGAKENTSLNSTIDLTFQHWAIYQLKRWMFFTVQTVETGTAVADKYIADVILNLGDFCNLLGQVLRHYYGDTITIDLNDDPNTGWRYKKEATPISINHSYIWDVLIKLYELFAVRWSIEPNGDSSHYVIKVGYPAEELDHIFEYGFEGGLLKVERQVQSEDIRNMLLGRGGEKNIPKYYFKKSPDEKKWRSDPDWIEELANIYFTNLMGATFRSYVQGWKAAHISKYPGYAAVGESNAYSPWAYRKGYTDSKFDPVEYVKDDESIAKYGPLLGGLDNNEEIYPSIQGSGMDVAVDVEQILSDDVEDSTENDARAFDVEGGVTTQTINPGNGYITVKCGSFTVPQDSTGVIEPVSRFSLGMWIDHVTSTESEIRHEREGENYEITGTHIIIFDNASGKPLESPVAIPPGYYRCHVKYSIRNKYERPIGIKITIGCTGLKLLTSSRKKRWRNTFSIWVKNIWDSTKLSTETNEQYAERVWKPILGDREGGEAAVMFTTGALAISEDYEFKIPKGAWPVYDTSKSLNGESSHWRIKLAKSDADLESTGLYVPSTQRQGKAGDKFVFIGTEMTHHYVVWAETALDDWKKDQLREKKDIKPTWVVTTDRVRLNNEGKANALIQQLRIGNSLRLADKRFITETNGQGEVVPSSPETLYLQSITYTYREPSSDDAALNPDVAIVLSNEYATAANPVATMQGEISTLQRQIGSISNVEQIVRAVGDKLYLRKDGISDRSLSPTQFFSLLTSGDFRAGTVGGAGWGLFKDANGNWVFEIDQINARQDLQVNNLVINQVTARGGTIVESAAQMEVSRVFDTQKGYECHFDTKSGTIANLFHIGDIAYCNRFTPENNNLKFYKRRVIDLTEGSITLSKTDFNGNGVPAEGDVIVHYGSYTKKDRRYVKVRDVVGGGYERYIEGLDSVNAPGVEYFFVGRQIGVYNGRPRFFIGDTNSYLEYINGELNFKGRLNLLSPVGDGTLGDVVAEAGNAGLRLVLSEQTAGVACDAQGNPVGQLPSTVATVYRGSDADTGWDFSASGTGCGVDKLSRNAFRVTSLTADTASVKVTATKAGQPTLRAQVSLYKVRPGADGKPASVYSVEAVPSVLLRKAAGGFNVQSVQVTKYRTTGDAPREATTEKCVHYSFEGADGGGTLIATGAGPSYIIDGIASRIPAEATAVVLELRQDNSATAAVLDTLTVPVLTDAADIEVGGTNLLRDTNQGVRGWTANGSADGLFSLREDVTAGVRAVELVNKAAADNPEWQIAMFLIPDPSVIEPGRQYRLSFDALSAVPGTHLWVNPQQATGKGWLTHERRDVALQTTLTRHVLSFTGKEPVTDNADGAYYMCFTVKPGAARWTEITLCNLKLEQGTVATAYSPSPLDTDYLTRAILDATKENSSFVGGLMLASLLRMGFTDADGTYRVMAGINGIARDKDGKDIALWAGGDMVDAANNTQGLAEFATALIRHNGTAYWCGNRIRFANDHIEVGDSVVLDKDGLRLIDPDTGTVRLSVADVPIGDDFPAVQTAVGIDKETAASIDIARYTPLSLGGGIQAQSWLYVSRGFSYDHPVQSAGQPTLPKGSYLSGKVSAQFDCPLATSDGIITEDIRLDSLEVRLFLEGNDEPVRRWLAPFDIRPYGNTFRFTASATLSHQTEAEGKYTLRVSLPASEQLLGERVASPTVSVKQTGKVSLGIEGQTVLGRDGLLSVWNGTGGTAAALLVRGDYAGFLVGDHGLRATTGGGFEKTLNGGRKWTPCYFPDKT